MDESETSERKGEKEKLSIYIDSDLLEQLRHLTNDPGKVVEVAIRQWLKGGRDQDSELSRTFGRNPYVPPKGEWND